MGRPRAARPVVARVTRAGAILLGLAVAAQWTAPANPVLRIVALVAIVAGMSLLLAGNEPWPHCCEHCHHHPEDDDEPARSLAELLAPPRHRKATNDDRGA